MTPVITPIKFSAASDHEHHAPTETAKPNFHLYQTKRFTYMLPQGKQPSFAQIHAQVDRWFNEPQKELMATLRKETVNMFKGVVKFFTGDESVEERLLPSGHTFGVSKPGGQLDVDDVAHEFERISKLQGFEKTLLTFFEALVLYVKAVFAIDDQAPAMMASQVE